MRILASLALLLLLTAQSHGADRLVLRLEGKESLSAFLAGADAAAARFDASCAAIGKLDTPYALWLEPGQAGWQVRGGQGPAAEAWRAAAGDASRTAAALGWAGLPRRMLVRHDQSGWFIGRDGARGAHYRQACQALGELVRRLAGADDLPAFASGRELRLGAGWLSDDRPLLAPGRAARLVIGLADSADPPQLAGPPALRVLAMSRGAEGWVADITLGPTPPGPAQLLVFDGGGHLAPAARLDVLVTAGSGGAAPVAAEPAALTAGVPASGYLAAGATDRWTLDLAEGGALTIESTGGTDLAARLEGPDGRVLASDDDGGAGYNFSLAPGALPPGRYVLAVSHPGAGAGAYEVTARTILP